MLRGYRQWLRRAIRDNASRTYNVAPRRSDRLRLRRARRQKIWTWRGTFEDLEERAVLAPLPVVTLTDPGPAMIGEGVGFTIRFDNQASPGSSVGYGPYVDLFVDTTGADGVAPGTSEPTDFDGLGAISAAYLGLPLSVTPVQLGPGATFVHPFATDATGSLLTGTAPAGFVEGDTLYVIELPFGSYVDEQPVVDIAIGTTISPEADVNTGLGVAAIGGFRFGADPLHNPASWGQTTRRSTPALGNRLVLRFPTVWESDRAT